MNPILGLLGIGQQQQPQGQQTAPVSASAAQQPAGPPEQPALWRRMLGGWFDDVNGMEYEEAQQLYQRQEIAGQLVAGGYVPEEIAGAWATGQIPDAAFGQFLTQGQQYSFDREDREDTQAHDFAFEDHKLGNDIVLAELKSNLDARAAASGRTTAIGDEIVGDYQPQLEALGKTERTYGEMNDILADPAVTQALVSPGESSIYGPTRASMDRLAALTGELVLQRKQEIYGDAEPSAAMFATIAAGIPGATVVTGENGDLAINVMGINVGLNGKLLGDWTSWTQNTPEQIEAFRIGVGNELGRIGERRQGIVDEAGRKREALTTGELQVEDGDPMTELGAKGVSRSVVLGAWDHVINAESGGNINATNTSKHGTHAGSIQIGPPLMADYNEDRGTNYTTQDVIGNEKLNADIVAWQADRFNNWVVDNGFDEYIGTRDANGTVITYTGLARAYTLGGPGGATRWIEHGEDSLDRGADGQPSGMTIGKAMAEGGEAETTRFGSNATTAARTERPIGPMGVFQSLMDPGPQPAPPPAPQPLRGQPLGTDFMPPVPQRPAPWETPVLPMNMPQPAQQLGARPLPLGRRVAEAPMEFEPPQRMQLAAPPHMAAQQLRQLAQVAQPQMQPQRTRMVDRVVAAVEAEDERGERSSSSRETRARVRERAARRRLQARRA